MAFATLVFIACMFCLLGAFLGIFFIGCFSDIPIVCETDREQGDRVFNSVFNKTLDLSRSEYRRMV